MGWEREQSGRETDWQETQPPALGLPQVGSGFWALLPSYTDRQRPRGGESPCAELCWPAPCQPVTMVGAGGAYSWQDMRSGEHQGVWVSWTVGWQGEPAEEHGKSALERH